MQRECNVEGDADGINLGVLEKESVVNNRA